MGEQVVTGLRSLGVGSFAGALVGALVGGLGGRLAMRVSGHLTSSGLAGQTTSNGNVLGEITLGGTLGLVVFGGLLAGLFGGSLYAAVRPALAWAGRWRGLVFGVALLVAFGSVVIDPLNFDFRRFGTTWLNVAMFASLFVLFGVLVAPVCEWVDRNSRGAHTMGKIDPLLYVVWLSALIALIFLGMIFVAGARIVIDPSTADSQEVATAAATAIAFMVLAIAVIRRLTRIGPVADVALAALAIVGGMRTLDGLLRLLG